MAARIGSTFSSVSSAMPAVVLNAPESNASALLWKASSFFRHRFHAILNPCPRPTGAQVEHAYVRRGRTVLLYRWIICGVPTPQAAPVIPLRASTCCVARVVAFSRCCSPVRFESIQTPRYLIHFFGLTSTVFAPVRISTGARRSPGSDFLATVLLWKWISSYFCGAKDTPCWLAQVWSSSCISPSFVLFSSAFLPVTRTHVSSM